VSRHLYRWGRYAATHAGRVLLVWLLALLAVGALLITQPKVIATGFRLGETPSQQVLDEIKAALPEAGGASGMLAFSTSDRVRVDSTPRADAIAASLQAAVETGYVVDTQSALADQNAQIRERVRPVVIEKVADKYAEQLPQFAALLESQASGLRLEATSGVSTASAADLEALADEAGRAAATATALVGKAPEAVLNGTSDLIEQMTALTARGRSIGAATAIGIPDGAGPIVDPQDAVEQALDQGVAAARARLDALLMGPDERGRPLKTSAGINPWVMVADDGRVAVASVQLTGQLADLPADAVDRVMAAVRGPAGEAGLTVTPSSSLEPTKAPVGGHEGIGLVVAALVLVLTLGSLLVAGLPLLTALVGVAIGVGGAFSLSAHFEMTTSTPALALMLGLAVGIDYALFIVHKQRALRTHLGLSPVEATARAVATAGTAVFFAGTTVVIALLGLLVLQIGFVTTMALAAAATVALAVVIALTALPALLGVLGERGRGSRPSPAAAHRDEDDDPSRFGRLARRWITAVTRRPALTIAMVIASLAVLALPVTGLHLGIPGGETASPGSAARVTYDALTATRGEGANAPLIVTMRPTSTTSEPSVEQLEGWQRELGAVESVGNVQLMGASPDHSLVLFSVTPEQGPTDPTTAALVDRLRGATLSGVERIGVTGLTAINIDLSEVLAAAIPRYLLLVVGLSLLVLLLVFRSILVPLVATAGFLLALAAAMGLLTLAFGTPGFTWLVGLDRAGPILSFLPIMATGVLYGLAMDYQVFLGSSMREEHVHGASARDAVRSGFLHAGRVVAAAAVIMVSVFGGFVLSQDTMIRQFGFVLSVGILIDAFVIRMVLLPAVLHLTGERAWWLPRWLDRLLPDVDIEGKAVVAAISVLAGGGTTAHEARPPVAVGAPSAGDQ
jgi:RND superfamily putative drug exporter